MISRIFIATIASCVLTQTPALAQRVRWNAPPNEWQWVVDEEVAGCQHVTVRSDTMNHDVGFNIFLPDSYDKSPTTHYPVVYFLHGAGGNEKSDADPWTIRQLIREGKIGDVIYVFPNGGHFSRYRDWPDADVKSETWIIKELIPYVDKNYRTIASRNGRALSGWSMGGDASLRFAFKYPDMFCAAGTYSAAIDWGAEGDDSIFRYVEKNIDQIRGKTGLLMVVGEDDRLFDNHKRLTPHLDKLDVEYTFHSLPGVGHNLGRMKQEYAEEVALMLAKQYSEAQP